MERVGGGDQAMRASNYKMVMYKSISISQGLCNVIKRYGRN